MGYVLRIYKCAWGMLFFVAMMSGGHTPLVIAAEQRERPLYETEPDSAVLKAERERLKTEKAELKAQSKELKKRRKKLKKEKKHLEKTLKHEDFYSVTDEERGALEQQLDQVTAELSDVNSQLDELDKQIKTTHQLIVDTKNFWALPYIAPAYSPELGFLIVGGGFFTFKTNRLDDDIARSTLPLVVGYSSTGSIIANANLDSFWWGDRIRVYFDFWLRDMPDNYWGIGYEAALSPSEPDDDVTGYDRLWWQIHPLFLFSLFLPNLYLGWTIDINQTVASDVNPEMALDPSFLEFGDDNFNAGMGVNLTYDSRDVPSDPHEGVYLSGTATFYGDYLGGDNRYQVYESDYRQYQTIGREGSTLTWQVRSRYALGDVPYGEMSLLGTPFDFRGYYWGRFRDKVMVYGLVEYRFMSIPSDPINNDAFWGRQGFAAWVGYGSLADRVVELTNWLPTVGGGYRAQLQPRMHLRVDLGFGKKTRAVYFQFGEAF